MRTLFFVVFSFSLSMSALANSVDLFAQSVKEKMLIMHVSGKNIIWNECGKRYETEKAEKRSGEYAEAIVSSIRDVQERTGIEISSDDVRAILFRESSDNECVIGRRETDTLRKRLQSEPEKDDYLDHIQKWSQAQSAASKACIGKTSDCRSKFLSSSYPEYDGINAWDIGAAQYRWPGVRVNGRGVTLPTGKKISKVGIDNLLDYRISIQLLVEDLVHYKEICKGHTHWLISKWGKKVRKLSVDEAYLVHHHTGTNAWSLKYWNKIQNHLAKIKSIGVIQTIAKIHDILFMQFSHRRLSV